MKRTIQKTVSLLLAVLFLLPGLGVGLTASAQDAVTFSVVPNVTTAHPGDTITYSVYMDPVTDLDGLQLTLGLPDGLTFGQADTNTNLLKAMAATCPEFSINFSESTLTLLIYTISPSEHFTSTENGVLLTFTCTVDDDASGEKTIDLPKHIITNRTIGGTVPTAYDPAGSAVTIMPAPPVKAVELVTGGAAANIAGAQKSSVYFGNYKQSSDGGDGYNVDPVKWRVLSNADGKLFLLSDQNLDVVRYNETNTDVTWESCTLRKWLNGYDGHPYDDTFIGSAFSEKEAAAITETAVANDDNSGKDTTDKVFLLSLAEVKNTAYGFTDNNSATDTRKATNTAYVAAGGHTGSTVVYSEGTADWWWLRSLYADGVTAFVVADSGNLNGEFSNVASKDTAVRPVLNVDLGKVLFTSAAENGKVGDGLTAVGGYTGSDWKLTVLDESRSGFTAKCTKIENGVYTVQYSGATTGTNEKISAMIVDEDGIVTYYGVLEAAKAGENTITLDVNGKLQSGDTLYVFNEQVNGDKKTDYASALVDVTEKSITTYDLWVGGVQFDENNLEINADDIPGVTGSATYDPENNELTLDGFQYTGEGYRYLVDPGTQNEQYYAAGIYYTGTDELTVRLVQENAVTVTGDATNSYGFRSENLRTAVTFTGTGSLTARGADNAQSISYGITVSGSLCVEKQATVTGVGGDSSKSSYGVTTYVLHTKLEVYGTLTGNGGSASNISCGVYGAEITVGTDAVLTAAGSAGDSSRGIIADSVTVRSGTVEAASGEGRRSLAFSNNNTAFDLSDDLTMRAGESKDKNEVVTGDGWKNQKYVLIEVFRYKAGDTLQYGTYPQSEVTDAATLTALNAKLKDSGWISYGYYVGTGDNNGEMAPDDFMRYQDVVLDGVKYRAVTFDSYRPYLTNNVSSADNSNQEEYGYEPSQTYWFQFEPVTWKVLDPDSGLVLCTGAIDAQAYHNYIIYDRYNDEYWGDADPVQKYRANDYAHSDIRAWLNEDFINTAFSTAQQENIKVSELDNSLANSGSDTYVYASTSDKIFLPSVSDVTAYGFDSDRNAQDEARRMAPSDYAKCQGIWENTTKTSFWWLRAPNSSGSVHTVSPYGMLGGNSLPCSTSVGVVPALRMQELKDDPTGAPLKVTPEVNVTIDNVTYNSKAIAVISISNNANGTVSVTVKGSGTDTYTYGGTVMNGVASVDLTNLPPDTYTATVDYSGDEASLAPASGTATFTVEKATPAMTVTVDPTNPASDGKFTLTSHLPADATGNVIYRFTDVDLLGYAAVENGEAASEFESLRSGTYHGTARYLGDEKYTDVTVSFEFRVAAASPNMTLTCEESVAYGETATVTAHLPRDTMWGTVTFYLDDAETGKEVFVSQGKAACTFENLTTGRHKVEAVFAKDDKYADETKTVYFTVVCDHVWNEPEWDWSQDYNNPTYSTTCSVCLVETASGSVASTPGQRVAATVDRNAYTPYSASVKLGNQTFRSTFELEEPGTMLAARKAAFEQYKDDLKQAAEDMRKDGDSEESKKLIDDTIAAIEALEYDESKPLDDNKKAVDDAAKLDELTNDLTDQRAADEVEKKINDIGEVAYTDESKAKIDEAREAYDNLTDEQKALVDNKDELEKAEDDYQLLDDKNSFEEYKNEQKQAAEEMRKDDDSEESKKLIDDTIAAIDALEYDESKPLDDNKKAVDDAARLDELTESLAEHRAVYYAVFKADGKEVASLPYTIDTGSIDEPTVPVKDNYTGAWPQYELKAGGVEINAVYVKNGALIITDNAKEQGEGRVLTFMETVTFTTDTSSLPEGAVLQWYVNGKVVSAETSITVESPKDDYTVQVKAFAKDGTLYTESEVLTVKVDHTLLAKLVYFLKLAFNPVLNAMKKVVPSFFSFLIALIKAVAAAVIAVVKSV